jgi:hypothetical protein
LCSTGCCCGRAPPSHRWELVYQLDIQDKVDYNAYADVKVHELRRRGNSIAQCFGDQQWLPRLAH